MIIAFDGTSGSGKSSIAKSIAQHLGLIYINTGEIYRSLTAHFISNQITSNVLSEKLVCEIDISLKNNTQTILINGIDYSAITRNKEVDSQVAIYSQNEILRQKVRDFQRNIASSGIVIEGRDVTSVVFPNADYKFFVDADLKVRSRRRFEQKAGEQTLEQIEQSLKSRDEIDTKRHNSPLKRTLDSYLIDTTFDTLDTSVKKVLNIIRG